MLGNIVKRKRLIRICPTLHHVACAEQRDAHHTMPHDERECGRLLLRVRQELRRNVAQQIAVECEIADRAEAVENPK